MGTKKLDRYICGPALVRALGPRAKKRVEAYEQIGQVDNIDTNGKTVGWNALFEWLCLKANIAIVLDVGSLAEEFLIKTERQSQESFEDWEIRFESSEVKTVEVVKKLSPEDTVKEKTKRQYQN